MRLMRWLTSIFLVLIAPIAHAQLADQATLRTDAIQEQITIVQQDGVLYLPIDRIVTALGGEFDRTDRGFALTLDYRRATFAPGDLEAVVGEDLIEMGGRPPIVIESRPFVPLQFVSDFLRPAELEPVWDPATKVLSIVPLRREVIEIVPSVTTVGPLTKIVFQLSSPGKFSIVRRQSSYVVQFRSPIRTERTQLEYEDSSLVSRMVFGGSTVEVFLRTPNVAADSYTLQNPARVILDLTRSSEPARPRPPEPTRTAPVDTSAIDTIVIDPGHGGKEVGAQGPTGALEKELTLEIARKLQSALTARGLRVILTRTDDQLLDLDQRTAIANQYKADLFLSIHLNAVPFQSAHGAETYFLSLEATDERARLSAERENAGPGDQKPAGSDLDLILWDLAQQRYLKESSRFAELIQNQMAAATGVERRGVKQAPFRVLLGAMMPAALVEVGFISNPAEEGRLRDSEYQDQIVAALAEAIAQYKGEYESRVGNLRDQNQTEETATLSALESSAMRSEP